MLVNPLIRTWDTVSDASKSAIVTFKANKTSVSSCKTAVFAAELVTVGVSATALTTISNVWVAAWLSSAPASFEVTLVVIVDVPE